LHILAVDDNPLNLELLTDIADANGYRVTTALNGLTALDLLQREPFDLVILDVNMPGMSGFEVCAKIKSDPATQHIPVLMLTALQDVQNRVQGLDAGADDYLTKPFSARELLARIETRRRAKSASDHLREEQAIIRKTFERFVSREVVEQLLKDPTQVKLGGKLQELTVMFADLENFTTISETTSPEQLLGILNTYHELTVRIIQQNGGIIDKFIGDAVMALYNTPLAQPDHILRAAKTALMLQSALVEFHQTVEPQFRMKINIGLHTGLAVVGNVGSPELMDFTAVGDTVNVAARLQSYGHHGQITISQSVHDAIANQIQARRIGAINLKGRAEAITAYELLGILND
jgi:class 3 adenylate cyclase